METLSIIASIVVAQIDSSGLPKVNLDSSLDGVLRLVFMAIGLLSVIFVAIGGLKYVLSGGDPQGTAKAKNTIIYALVGLIVAVSAFTIVEFVASRI